MTQLELSGDQNSALRAIYDWYRSGSPEMKMGGLAGTGKTTIIGTLPTQLTLAPDQIHFCAPTGKAAKVLSKKLPKGHEATTVHRLLYRPVETHCVECPHYKDETKNCHGTSKQKCEGHKHPDPIFSKCGVEFRRIDPELDGIVLPRLIVVDEASMVDEYMHADLMSLGVPILFVGDHGQLPPVNGNLNLMAENALDIKLERIHRQQEGNLILEIAYRVRNGERMKYFAKENCAYGPRSAMDIAWGEGVEAQVITYTNRTRMGLNRIVRKALKLPEGVPTIGDRVICLRNHNEKGIVNGTIGTIDKVIPQGDIYEAVINLVGEDKPYEGPILAEQFTEADTQWAPKEIDLWTFAYALTCHKAQGSEAEDVIVVLESFHPRMSLEDRARWLYTAVTRAKSSLTIIDWNN